MPETRAVFFDAAGTLFHVREPVGQAYSHAARRHGLCADPRALDDAFRRSFASAPPPTAAGVAPAPLAERERSWWRRIVVRSFAEIGITEGVEEVFAELFRHYGTAEAWRPYPDTAEALAALRTLGFTLGIVSNFDRRLRSVLAGLGLAECFSTVTLSWEVGAAKPDPAIFRAALAAHGVAAEAACHVGDHPREDVAAAARAGLKAVLLLRGAPATPQAIGDLRQLADLLRAP